MIRSFRRGFTLVEMLVVISIIGVLMSLLLPAVNVARELGRRTQCSNNLRQIATAFTSHESAQGFMPTGGWGYGWTGDPDRGYDRKQPGGWVYNIQPYMDAAILHDSGTGCADSNSVLTRSKRNLAAEVAGTLQPMLICPSRRRPRTYPFRTPSARYNYDMLMPDRSRLNSAGATSTSMQLTSAARSDYAANAGYQYLTNTPGQSPVVMGKDSTGPNSLATADSLTPNRILNIWPYSRLSGICFQRSEVRGADITDGLASTYLVGEKSIDPEKYSTGDADNDSLHCYVGFHRDTICSTYINVNDGTGYPPLLDTPGTDGSYRFGSAHTAGFNMAMCDGSVRMINYAIDPVIHLRLGSRVGNPATEKAKDGTFTPVDISSL